MFSVVAEAEERFKYRVSSMIDSNHRISTYKRDWLKTSLLTLC